MESHLHLPDVNLLKTLSGEWVLTQFVVVILPAKVP